MNREAFGLGQLVGGGLLPRGRAEEALTAAAEQAGLGALEIRSTLKSGLDDGEKVPRGMPASQRPKFIMGQEGPKAIHENICRALRQPGWDGLIVYDDLGLRPILLAATLAHARLARADKYPHAWDDGEDAVVTSFLQAEYGVYIRPN